LGIGGWKSKGKGLGRGKAPSSEKFWKF